MRPCGPGTTGIRSLPTTSPVRADRAVLAATGRVAIVGSIGGPLVDPTTCPERSGPPSLLGNNNHDQAANEVVWDFFSRFRL